MDGQQPHIPRVIWFTGLSGSGKTTLALALKARLAASGITRIYHLDGDQLRQGINADLGFSLADRDENLRRAAHIARLFLDEGYWVLASFITPMHSQQAQVRQLLPEGQFVEVYLDTPLEVCQQRDPKQLYARAEVGQVADMTGVRSPYEPPRSPELRLNTARLSIENCMDVLMSSLAEQEGGSVICRL